MGDQRRWAARYQFLEELWRGRDRIVCDRELEAVLHAGAGGPTAELLAGLVPSSAGGDRSWVALHNDRRAASFARARSGTVFVGLDDAAEIASDEPWEVALVHLSGQGQANPTRADLLGAGLESFLEVVGERLEDDATRSAVLSLDCGEDEDQAHGLLTELVAELFGDGRVYGLTRPGMVAFYDFGRVLADDDADDAGDPEIEVDNTLGSENPRFECFVVVVGARLPSEGVTFIELPPGHSEVGEAGAPSDDELGAVRAQLLEAQRRGDLLAIERQSLLETLEQAEDRISSLEEQVEERGDRATSTSANHASSVDQSARVDELLAREQTLRWELEQARGEIERLEARPVEALEAELAQLRDQLERATEPGEPEDSGETEDLEDLGDLGDPEALGEIGVILDELDELDPLHPEPSEAQIREWGRSRLRLDRLLRKLERGGPLSALELHRELIALKRLL